MKKLLDTFTTEEPLLHTAKLFRIAILSWFFLDTILLLPYADRIWSTNALIEQVAFDSASPWAWIAMLLLHPDVAPYYMVFVVGKLVMLTLAIAGIRPRLTTLFAWFFTVNLTTRAYAIMDGGDNLAQLLFLYLLLMNTSGEPIHFPKSPTLEMLAKAVSNAAMFLCRAQIAIVYLTAVILKMQGQLWQSGMALYYILQAEAFTHPVYGRMIVDSPTIAMLGAYFALAFQLAFPFLAWFRKTRPVLLVAGVFLHVGIASVMGLFTFGLIMCLSYVAWFPDSWSKWVLARFEKRGAPGHLRPALGC